MRALLLFTALLLAPAALYGQSKNLSADRDLQNATRARIEQAGLHCPWPHTMTLTGEDARGAIFKIDCVSADLKSSWSIRFITNNGEAHFEPW